ncbi:putative CRISPR-associated protein [uncultured Thiohalocapsa sp.]|uniref:putative CRISPR-associated protein n=1 Tax=uncultured Thiohalocapsa sp. TaxID=768990 RepID=UPI0025F2AEEC|nr:putative CRISPR-associated protein [uncultured Thiohalocapsa sp.]
MRKLVVSTCGTSLLTNLAGNQRGLVIRHANAREPAEVPAEDRAALEQLIQRGRSELAGADAQAQERLSAELNGLLRLYDGRLGDGGDHHWLIATDTWLGTAIAELISEVLETAGHGVEVKRIADLRTDDLGEFRAAMAELARLCAQELRGMAQGGWRVVFNLTGGFKSVQGFMQALGMLYADESVYVFERTRELLRLPRLPIAIDADTLVHEHQHVFRRLAAGLPVTVADAAELPDTLTMELDGQVTLSVWGDVVWSQAGPELLGERLWPAVDDKLRYGEELERSVAKCSADELRMVNERLSDLARRLHDNQYNPDRLDFTKLKTPHGRWTHECDAWASGAAKRLFGYFDDGVFVVDQLAAALH